MDGRARTVASFARSIVQADVQAPATARVIGVLTRGRVPERRHDNQDAICRMSAPHVTRQLLRLGTSSPEAPKTRRPPQKLI